MTPAINSSTGFSPRTGPEAKYIYSPDLTLAVQVALATGRVLLVTGDPGTGKSTLAADIAETLSYAFYSLAVTSSTESRDLLYGFDQVERLSDAYAQAVSRTKNVAELARYIRPGVLWWAFRPDLATTRFGADLPTLTDPSPRKSSRGAVVLVDEIDKADPDVPNDLLVPLDTKTFPVPPLSEEVTVPRDVLVVITTNGERELPQAFLRRCIVARLERPDARSKDGRAWLERVTASHFAQETQLRDLLPMLLDAYADYSEVARGLGVRPPATAEFLDAVRAALALHLRGPKLPVAEIVGAALWKHAAKPPLAAKKDVMGGATLPAAEEFASGPLKTTDKTWA